MIGWLLRLEFWRGTLIRPAILSKESSNLMTSKFLRCLTLTAFTFSLAAMAQTGSPSAALPAAPSAAVPSTTCPMATSAGGTKIGTINVEQAIFASNEGQRDFDALSKKLEPKQTELKTKSDEIEALKKQLNTQGDKMNDEAKANLAKQIDQKQKSL